MRSCILAVLFTGAVVSCTPLPELPQLEHADLVPPSLTGVVLADPRTLRVSFDEPAWLVAESVLCSSGITGTPEVRPGASGLDFVFADPPAPGVEHSVEAQVADERGNQLRFLIGFYGTNAMLPALLINEFTTQGSGNHPDMVELLCLSSGNLAGACLYEGTPGNWEQRFVFPNVEVAAGAYIVIHFKPEGIPEEINEVRSPTESGGLDASDSAWDFWVDGGSGLSGNNGAVTLCAAPGGAIIDAVLYSNRTSDSDESYRGFGSRDVMERADELLAAGAWSTAGTAVAPEDAIDPEPSTATRSICRGSSGRDTNHKTDWHITPTSGATFGSVNTDEVYVP